VFFPVAGCSLIANRTDDPAELDAAVELTHGGAPLIVPRRMLISRNNAAEIAKAYITAASGERPPHACWEA
jgi:hypothetical protein